MDQTTPWDINIEDNRYAGSFGEQLLNDAIAGGIKGAFNTGLNKLKDKVKNKVLNKPLDDGGKQVAQLPHVIDITLGFTSMATANRRVGGDMFGCWVNQGGQLAWVTNPSGNFGFPKRSVLDRVFGKEGGGFAKSTGGKLLNKALGGF